jgi:hypothetical protein
MTVLTATIAAAAGVVVAVAEGGEADRVPGPGVVADLATDPVIVHVPGNASDHVPSHVTGLVTSLGISLETSLATGLGTSPVITPDREAVGAVTAPTRAEIWSSNLPSMNRYILFSVHKT